MYRLATCFWVSLRTLSPQGLSIAPVKLLHPQYVEVTDYQLFVINTEEKRIGFYV